jgi:hypothetical protein
MNLASRYVNEFDHKWIGTPVRPDDGLLGTADVQTLADLNNTMQSVDAMRVYPAGRRLLLVFGASALIPLLPLFLFRYEVTELAEKLVKAVIGV